ncbi:hypothetical protein STENM327S_06883 [Streptomyces tendae]
MRAEALLGEHAGQGGGGAGDAHDVALGHGAQGTAGPQRGGRGGRRLEAVGESRRAGQADGLGAAGQHRLGAEVDADSGDLAGQQLAADAAGRLQDGHPGPALQEAVGGGQSGDTGSHDDHVSGSLFSGPVLWRDLTRMGLARAHLPSVSDPAGTGPTGPASPERDLFGTVPRRRAGPRARRRDISRYEPGVPTMQARRATTRAFLPPARALAGMLLVTALALTGCSGADAGSDSDGGAKAAAPREGAGRRARRPTTGAARPARTGPTAPARAPRRSSPRPTSSAPSP